VKLSMQIAIWTKLAAGSATFIDSDLECVRRKPVVFPRYWGEMHVPQSPANIRDVWQCIYGFLNDNLG